MDAAGHLAAAEALLASAAMADAPVSGEWRIYAATAAGAHAQIAAAIEAGAPHVTDSTGAGSGK